MKQVLRTQWVGSAIIAAIFWWDPASALEVSVSGYIERAALHREYGAWLGIRIPFQRFFSSEYHAAERVSPADAPLETAGTDVSSAIESGAIEPGLFESPASELDALDLYASATEAIELQQLAQETPKTSTEPPETARAAEAQSSAPQPAAGASTAAVEPLWRLSSAQLRGLVAAVVAEDARRLARVTSLSDRARTSAWLPDFKVRAGRNSDQTLRLSPTTDDPDRWALSGGSGLRLEGELHWQFDRLVFASEEVAIERVRVLMEQQRQRGVLDLLQWVFRWQVAVMRTYDPELTETERREAALQAEQTAGALDALSGGWFSTHVARANTSGSVR